MFTANISYTHKILLSLTSLLLFCMFIASSLLGQDVLDPDEILTAKKSGSIPDSLSGWQVAWSAGLNGSQATFDNWSQGGVNSLSLTSSTVFDSKYRKGAFAYQNSVNMKYGRTKVDNEAFRKTDDKLLIGNRFDYFFNEVMTFYSDLTLRTQFDKGFNFPSDEPKVLISDFFAPGYFTESFGISYKPYNFISVETGMGFKQTIVRIDSLAPLYGVSAGDNIRLEAGWAISMSFSKEVFTNVTLTSRLDSFTSVETGINSTDVYWSNEIVGKVNDFMNTTLQLELLYDDDISSELQLKQIISIGIGVSIF